MQSALLWAILGVGGLAAIRLFWTPLSHTWETWMTSPEYNYGPIIPLIAAIMIWRDLTRSKAAPGPGWAGITLAILGLLFSVFGQISAFVFLAQIGLLLFVIGVAAAAVGDRRAISIAPGLVYLGFAIPLARLLQANLSAHLQLISSSLGVLFIRAFGVPVYLEGNVIDLGTIQLQVAEACSGLRYLFPLASFSYLCAYVLKASPWQRAVIFLSALPITIVLNSARIGITGILADGFGLAAATGFFHDFEGWLVFCVCIAVLFLEMKLLCLIGPGDRSLLRRMDLSWPGQTGRSIRLNFAVSPRMISLALATVAGLAAYFAMGNATISPPARSTFASFPRVLDDWNAVEVPVDPDALAYLVPTDYLSLTFSRAISDPPANLWVAYYDQQGIGEAIHSPRICIPGGGWLISSLQTRVIGSGGDTATVNRAIIERNGSKQLVYYWFQGRGRIESDEYKVKAHLIADALFKHRTDGALVRFAMPVDPKKGVAATEAVMLEFIARVRPLLQPYLPD